MVDDSKHVGQRQLMLCHQVPAWFSEYRVIGCQLNAVINLLICWQYEEEVRRVRQVRDRRKQDESAGRACGRLCVLEATSAMCLEQQ